jgi:hypothetical protein
MRLCRGPDRRTKPLTRHNAHNRIQLSSRSRELSPDPCLHSRAEHERMNYAEILDAFIGSESERLEGLFRDYGAHSAVSHIPDYVLFGQAESIVLLERIGSKPHKLVSQWKESGLPYSHLETLAGAAGISLP